MSNNTLLMKYYGLAPTTVDVEFNLAPVKVEGGSFYPDVGYGRFIEAISAFHHGKNNLRFNELSVFDAEYY